MESGPEPIRVVLVEDHPVLRLGLRRILDHDGIQVCGEADSIATGIQAVATHRPDLALVDLALGQEDGAELVRQLAKGNPDLRILVYSGFQDATHVERSLQAGAMAYVTKGETYDLLALAIRECAAGRRYLSPIAKRLLLDSPYVGELLTTLSLKEQQVYKLLGQGVSTSEIAAQMDLSPRTVETYFARIQIKLGLSGMRELKQQVVAKPI